MQLKDWLCPTDWEKVAAIQPGHDTQRQDVEIIHGVLGQHRLIVAGIAALMPYPTEPQRAIATRDRDADCNAH